MRFRQFFKMWTWKNLRGRSAERFFFKPFFPLEKELFFKVFPQNFRHHFTWHHWLRKFYIAFSQSQSRITMWHLNCTALRQQNGLIFAYILLGELKQLPCLDSFVIIPFVFSIGSWHHKCRLMRSKQCLLFDDLIQFMMKSLTINKDLSPLTS